MSGMKCPMGFWSINPATGTLTCCPTADAILGFAAGTDSRVPRDVLLQLPPADRRRLLRAALAALRRRSTFDVVVWMRPAHGGRLLRVIGGAGYQGGQRDPDLHGLVEQIVLQDPAALR
jgi:hypothetical protein